ncbi:Hypothetical protein PP7435_CHR3-2304 [Komagataella phaffii CBS 7435]|uniref:Uncharacterized protein n=1 Tax=Komagataella phaffii (strain ATCC 76273 / CBS 7435 / CECT 11047 / NRRL Y-11430 / Wegner 21-1) TaxID=981350 RepID=A0A1G4KQH7_KOMPC|nr:Hypothetical protein BQ9382_C3-4428 [Komagataella phaffii CBS 7435]SCV12261.1 Hypothetical protein PP7435_CHR3-2304 [Komagataella phaffii CBS 7435]
MTHSKHQNESPEMIQKEIRPVNQFSVESAREQKSIVKLRAY